jgi:signal transduction histidine kinase
MSVYIILPLISGIFVLFCGFLVLSKNRKLKVNQIFFFFTVTVTIWLLATFVMFLSKTDEQAIFWDRIVYIGVVFIPITFYHFVLLFTKIKNQKRVLYLGYFLSFIFLILSRTNYFLEDLYKYSWGVHTQARFFHHIFLAFFAFYICLSFSNIYRYYRQTKDIERMQAAYIFLVLFIITLNSLAFLPAYNISISPLFSYLLPVIAVLILSFAIIKYHLFEIRVILTEILVGVMGVILLILPFVMPTINLKILTIFIFFLFCIFGYLLVKATHQEIQRREEIERLYEELKVLDKAKSEFISMASHQLRTPLSAIKGYISMLIEGSYGQISEKAKEKLKNVFQSNERLINLVNNLLNISKIELGKMELEKEKIQIEDLIESCCEELKIEAEKKGLKFYFSKPKEILPKIDIDSLKIRQVILNLIDNAIRYTQKGEIEIKAEKTNSNVLISVRDTGEGLTKEEQKRIFEGFTRGGAGTTYWIEGAGLGLYVAKKYIELHQGKIWAESQGKGKGSVFYVELPIKG